MIRPMRRERVQFSSPRSPSGAGLTLGDVVMLSGERIFGWVSDEYVADDIFSHIVDYDEVAPFGTSDNGLYNNAVNGFIRSDGLETDQRLRGPEDGPATACVHLCRSRKPSPSSPGTAASTTTRRPKSAWWLTARCNRGMCPPMRTPVSEIEPASDRN
jgi:hypothetical protein